MFSNFSLKRCWLPVVVLFAAVVVGWSTYRSALDSHKEDVRLYLVDHARLIKDYLGIVDMELDVAAHDLSLKDFLGENNGALGDIDPFSRIQKSSAVNHLLLSLKGSHGIEEVFVLSKNGSWIMGTFVPADKRIYGLEPYFRDAIEKGKGVYLAGDPSTGRVWIYLSKRILYLGKPVGAFVTMIKPKALLKGVARETMIPLEDVESLGVDRCIVAFATPDGILSSGSGVWSLELLSEKLKRELENSGRFPLSKVKSLGFPKGTWIRLIRDKEISVTVSGTEYLLFSSPIVDGKLYLVNILSTNAVKMTMGSFLRPLRWLLGGFFVAMLMVGLLAFAMRREREHLEELNESLEKERTLLKKVKEKYSGVIENTSQGFFEVDVDTLRITYANPALCNMLDMEQEEIIGKTPFDLVDEKEKPLLMEASRETGERGKTSFQVSLIAKDGSEVPVLISGTLIKDEEGRPVSRFAFVSDRSEEEEKLRTIRLLSSVIEQAPSSIVVTDVQGNIVYVNPAFTEMTGYSKEEAIGQNPRVLKSGYHPPEFYEDLWSTILSGNVWRGRIYNKRKDGTLFWEDAVIAPIFSLDGTISNFMAIKSDITEKVELERILEERTAEIEAIIDHMDIGLIYAKRGVIEKINKKVEEIFGVSEKEVMGSRVDQIATSFVENRVIELLYARLKRDGKASGEFEITRRDSTKAWVAVYGTMLGGEDHRLIWIVEDITYRKRIEMELIEAKNRAEEASRAKSRFLANMSHEIRTPMNAIIGMTRLALGTKLDPEQEHYLRTSLRSAETLLSLINDILDLSKIEAGELQIEMKPFNICGLLDDVKSLFSFKAEEKGLSLKVACEVDREQVFLSDPLRISQVLVNLIGNALKFTEEGEIEVRAKVKRDDLDRAEILFEVEDTGIGIPQDKLDIIFERFRQADDSVVRRFGGTGLGLAISKAIVEMLGGEIGVESQEGKGSLFWFVLPMDKAYDAHEELAPSHLSCALGSLDILVVEDNDINRELARRMLSKEGHRVVEAGSGIDALRILSHREFDVVFMDVQMPQMDGLTTTRIIRAIERGEDVELPFLSEDEAQSLKERLKNKHTIIVAMTAHALSGDKEMCLQAGMDAYVSKPFTPEDVTDVLCSLGVKGKSASSALVKVETKEEDLLTATEDSREADAPVSLAQIKQHVRKVAGMEEGEEEEFLKMAAETLSSLLENLQRELSEKRFEDASRTAHTLKGSLASLGIGAASEAAFEVERNARDKKEDFPFESRLERIKNYAKELLTLVG